VNLEEVLVLELELEADGEQSTATSVRSVDSPRSSARVARPTAAAPPLTVPAMLSFTRSTASPSGTTPTTSLSTSLLT